ncbi:MAG: response regulator [Candidatus Omnitrophica bacterium]|nr:response regulator [Candidatus Omnitrophota bacterium]
MPQRTRAKNSNSGPSEREPGGVAAPIPFPIRKIPVFRGEEDSYRKFFEESRDAFVITSRDGLFVDLNEAAAELFGRSRQELLGKSTLQVYADPMERERFVTTIEAAGGQGNLEVRIRRSDGRIVECLASSNLWKGKDGGILGYRSILRDVTRERELEMQLHQSQKMEAVGILAGGIAHDFNNLLQTIISYSQFAQAEFEPGSRGLSDIARVLEAAHRAADLTKQLLTFSRRNKLESADFDVRPLVRDMVALLERTFPPSISISCELERNLPLVHGDPTQIQQVLLNLAINARDAMPNGGRLDISVRAMDSEGGGRAAGAAPRRGKHLILRFLDTGCGIPQEDLPRIFDPFFTTKEPGKGTGLGLSTCYGIVDRHGGRIQCESKVGRGACFTVYLPAGNSAASPEPEPLGDKDLPRGNETVLIADDDPLILAQAARILESLGYVVLSASSGRGAWELFRRMHNEIDLVLLDLQMPGMDGLECCREILALRPEVHLILAGGFIDSEVERTIAGIGQIGVLHKPYHHFDLAHSVRQALDRRG